MPEKKPVGRSEDVAGEERARAALARPGRHAVERAEGLEALALEVEDGARLGAEAVGLRLDGEPG